MCNLGSPGPTTPIRLLSQHMQEIGTAVKPAKRHEERAYTREVSMITYGLAMVSVVPVLTCVFCLAMEG
jgi:hypothetical protein